MRRTIYFSLFVLAALGLAVAATETAPSFQFRFTDKPGLYSVGFRVIEQYDHSRIFHIAGDGKDNSATAENARPLQTLVWYPAKTSNKAKMTVGDYAELVYAETNFNQPTKHGKVQSFVEDFTRGTTTIQTWAVRDAAMEAGRFPLVIYAPSLNAPATENIELCEYLASHGFVVLASPGMGATARDMTISVSGANAEAKDISFLIDSANTLPDAKISSIAVIGYSWGGMSALFAVARDKRIEAFVSLDGSFRYSPVIVHQAGNVHPDQITVPLLFISRAEETLESNDQNKDQFCTAPNVLNEWTDGDLLHLRMLAMSHIEFSSLFLRSERFRNEGLQFAPADYSLEEGAESYNWVVRYTVEFLNAYLKGDQTAIAFLKRTPAENGVPRHLMATSFRPASVK